MIRFVDKTGNLSLAQDSDFCSCSYSCSCSKFACGGGAGSRSKKQEQDWGLRFCAILLVALVFTPFVGRADEQVSDVQDILYLADECPIFLRLHVRMNGKSHQTVWNEYVDKYFDELDKDDDGMLSAKEAAGLPKPKSDSKSAGDSVLKKAGSLIKSLGKALSKDNSKKTNLTKEDVIQRLRSAGKTAFAIKTVQRQTFGGMQQGAGQRSAADEMYKRLDKDGDKRLSEAELKAAYESLAKLDLDDDESISVEELQTSNPYAAFMAAQNQAVQKANSPFHSLQETAGIASKLQKKYGADNLGLAEAVFDRFDGDSDGKLSTVEIEKLLRDPPISLELTIKIGEDDPLEVVKASDVSEESGVTIRRVAGGAPALVSRDTHVELAVDKSTSSGYGIDLLISGQFTSIDRDNNGYIDKKEMGGRGAALGIAFDAVDRDGDEKIFKKELVGYLEEQSVAARRRTVLNVTGPNRNLVEILDANADRMLSPRELATAVEHFPLWDKNGDGLLAKSEVPRQYRLTIGRATPDIPLLNQLQAATSIYGPQAQSNGPKIGPRWFQKMDRNGDGDVSRREFLFDAALFAKLDTNKDKRIDAKEAADLK